MSTLSEQERNGLDDVFLSISSTQSSLFKYKISHYHACITFYLKAHIKALNTQAYFQKKFKKSLKNTLLQKNLQKTEKTRKI